MAERARPELHAALEPADDVARVEPLRHEPEELVVGQALGFEAGRGDRRRARLVVEARARVGVAHDERARPAELAVPDVVGGADRGAGVADGGWGVEALDLGLAQEPPVRDRVERDAAREAEVAEARALEEPRDQVEVDLLEALLQRGGDVHVPLLDRIARLAGRPERLDEPVGEDRRDRRLALVPDHVDALLVVGEPVEIEEEEVFVRRDDVAQRPAVRLRVAVRREAHHLPLVSVVREAEVLGQRGVEHPERVREEDAVEHLDRAAAADRGEGRAEVAEAVDREDRRLLEGRDEERARRVREVVLDVVDPGLQRRPLDPAGRGERGSDVAGPRGVVEPRLQVAGARAVADPADELLPDVRVRVARDGDVVEAGRVETALLQAPARGVGREAGDVLDPGEALLLGGSEQLAVDDERRRGVAVVRVQAEDGGHMPMLARPSVGSSAR